MVTLELTEDEFLGIYKEVSSSSDGSMDWAQKRLNKALDDWLNEENGALTKEEQEKARREYLEGRGIPFH